MKLVIVALCLAAVVLADDSYKDLGEDLDVPALLDNERLLKGYLNCLIYKGPCTPEIKKVRETIPDALMTKCAKCSEKQKYMGKLLAQGVKKHHPDLWAAFIEKYDPEGKYQQAFKEFLADQ